MERGRMKRKRRARRRLGWARMCGLVLAPLSRAALPSTGDPRGDVGGHHPAEVSFMQDCRGEQ